MKITNFIQSNDTTAVEIHLIAEIQIHNVLLFLHYEIRGSNNMYAISHTCIAIET